VRARALRGARTITRVPHEWKGPGSATPGPFERAWGCGRYVTVSGCFLTVVPATWSDVMFVVSV
jgi:hypothetical protein